uniref:Uncharacterized protein n=1 Tax=Anguilla anguilla TaxID=7936 RepID=A0A0E9T607_ANGAN
MSYEVAELWDDINEYSATKFARTPTTLPSWCLGGVALWE